MGSSCSPEGRGVCLKGARNKDQGARSKVQGVLRWRRWHEVTEVVVVGISPRAIRILPLHPLHEGDKKKVTPPEGDKSKAPLP